jgi:hypothetical protein
VTVATLAKAVDLLQETRLLFVAATVDPCYDDLGREYARRELAALDLALSIGTLDALQDVFVQAVVLSSFEDGTAKGRGLAGRVRRFGEATWPADYGVVR